MSGLTFLGCGDSQGVPRWWCDCPVCGEARSGGLNLRSRPSALLESEGRSVLLDCGPEFRVQAMREGIRRLDALVLTHAHNDHLLGLGDFMDWLRWTGEPAVVYAPAKVLPQVQARFPYLFTGPLAGRFRALPEEGVELAGWRVTAFEVPHGFNGQAHALRLERVAFRWVYMPDAIGLPEQVEARLHGLDLLVLGTSFWHEDAPYEGRSVHDVREALELTGRVRPKRTVFTHLGHGVDCRRAGELPPGHALARDGLRLGLASD